jgi:hypothetical protein
LIVQKNHDVSSDFTSDAAPLENSGQPWVVRFISWQVETYVIPSHWVVLQATIPSAEFVSQVNVPNCVVGARSAPHESPAPGFPKKSHQELGTRLKQSFEGGQINTAVFSQFLIIRKVQETFAYVRIEQVRVEGDYSYC